MLYFYIISYYFKFMFCLLRMIFFKHKKGKRHHHVMLIEDCFSCFIFIFIYIMMLIFHYKQFIIYLNENMINFKHI